MSGPPPGRLLCVGGPPGSGKTTVGGLLARRAAACLADLDSVTTPLVEALAARLGVPADLDAPDLVALRDARYHCLAAVVADNLAAGLDVVAVAPFTREAADGAAWRAWGSTLGARSVTTAWLDLDPGVAADRARARGLARDRAKGTRSDPPVAAPPAGADVRLDAREDPVALADRLAAAWPVR